MRNVKQINTRMNILGQDVSMPVWIAPMGMAKTAGEDGEAALGAGAAAGGTIHCQSTATSMSVEKILTSVPDDSPYFFQLYVNRNRLKTEELLHKLDGMPKIKALFVTVDLPVVSKRDANERVMEEQRASYYSGPNLSNKPDRKGRGLARSIGSVIDWALEWDDILWIKKHTRLPIVIKEI